MEMRVRTQQGDLEGWDPMLGSHRKTLCVVAETLRRNPGKQDSEGSNRGCSGMGLVGKDGGQRRGA